MTNWKRLLLVAVVLAPPLMISNAFAANPTGNPFLPGGPGNSGTHKYQGSAKEQAACRPDVRRYCSAVKAGSDGGVFLSCLKANRAKLSKACLNVLASHGQ
jgi:hypothetical protein